MPTQARSPAEHYAASERLIRATVETPENAPALAIDRACLARRSPRRALRGPQPRHTNSGGLPPHLTWGDDQ
jgi:hypothetical protein